MSLRRQEFQQFCFGGIAPEGLIDIPRSCFSGQFCFHDDHILSPIQPQDFGQQFGHITVQTIEVPHPAHIAWREASHVGALLTQVTCSRHRRTFFGTGANSLANLAVQFHLRQFHADSQIQCSVHGAVVDFFANIHGFSFLVRNTLLLVKAEKNTANCHAFLCFDALFDLYDLFP